jgi:hypothetical protein
MINGRTLLTSLLISVHVVAGLLFLGPVTVAGSLFPRYARQALEQLPAREQPYGAVRLLHRITTGYAVAAITVPVFGLSIAGQEHVFGQAWLQAAIGLVAAAAALLGLVVLPAQRKVITELERAQGGSPVAPGSLLARLSAATGLFSLAWVSVAVLMITKPGGTP